MFLNSQLLSLLWTTTVKSINDGAARAHPVKNLESAALYFCKSTVFLSVQRINISFKVQNSNFETLADQVDLTKIVQENKNNYDFRKTKAPICNSRKC